MVSVKRKRREPASVTASLDGNRSRPFHPNGRLMLWWDEAFNPLRMGRRASLEVLAGTRHWFSPQNKNKKEQKKDMLRRVKKEKLFQIDWMVHLLAEAILSPVGGVAGFPLKKRLQLLPSSCSYFWSCSYFLKLCAFRFINLRDRTVCTRIINIIKYYCEMFFLLAIFVVNVVFNTNRMPTHWNSICKMVMYS